MSRVVDFWYFLISLRALAPGRNLLAGAGGGALCLGAAGAGRGPPVDFLAVGRTGAGACTTLLPSPGRFRKPEESELELLESESLRSGWAFVLILLDRRFWNSRLETLEPTW
jgi:hypothetical protein